MSRQKPKVDTFFHKGARLARTEQTYETALEKAGFPMSPAEKKRFHRGFAQGGVGQRLNDLLELIGYLTIEQLEALKPELDELYKRYAPDDDEEDDEEINA